MALNEQRLPRYLIGEAFVVSKAGNDNLELAPPWQTPAEVLQEICRIKDEMQRELAADFTLRSCPEHRQHWESLLGAEQYALWRYYGIRQG